MQPSRQRVGAEVPLPRRATPRRRGAAGTARARAGRAAAALPIRDRRVRDHRRDARSSGTSLGDTDPDRSATPGRRGVGRAQGPGPGRWGRPPTPCVSGWRRARVDRDRPVPAAEVDQVAGRPALGRVATAGAVSTSSALRAGVDASGGEHPAVGVQCGREVGQVEVHLGGARRAGRGAGRSSGLRPSPAARRVTPVLRGPIRASRTATVTCGGCDPPADDPHRRRPRPAPPRRGGRPTSTRSWSAHGVDVRRPCTARRASAWRRRRSGVGQRFFVYDLGDEDGPRVLLNPEITGSDGEWEFAEGCLSMPGQHFDVVRPRQIGVRGIDLARQRRGVRGRRAAGPPDPARTRPPRRHPGARPPRRGGPQGGEEAAAGVPDGPAGPGACAGDEEARSFVPVQLPPVRLVYLGSPADGRTATARPAGRGPRGAAGGHEPAPSAGPWRRAHADPGRRRGRGGWGCR